MPERIVEGLILSGPFSVPLDGRSEELTLGWYKVKWDNGNPIDTVHEGDLVLTVEEACAGIVADILSQIGLKANAMEKRYRAEPEKRKEYGHALHELNSLGGQLSNWLQVLKAKNANLARIIDLYIKRVEERGHLKAALREQEDKAAELHRQVARLTSQLIAAGIKPA